MTSRYIEISRVELRHATELTASRQHVMFHRHNDNLAVMMTHDVLTSRSSTVSAVSKNRFLRLKDQRNLPNCHVTNVHIVSVPLLLNSNLAYHLNTQYNLSNCIHKRFVSHLRRCNSNIIVLCLRCGTLYRQRCKTAWQWLLVHSPEAAYVGVYSPLWSAIGSYGV